jgi:putative FmdB family regulatory protein
MKSNLDIIISCRMFIKEVFVLPIYEYACTSCGDHFEVMQKLNDQPVTECGLCKGKVRKLLGAPALQFKGSGWYVTDYAGKNPSSNGGGEKKEGAEPKAVKDAPAACACNSATCGQAADKS